MFVNKKMLTSLISTRNLFIKIILYLLITYLFWQLINYLGNLISKNNKYDDQDINTYVTSLRLIFYVLSFIILFIFLGLKKEFIVTYFSGFSLVLAYSLQNHISNIMSGLLLLYSRPIQINDYLELNENNKGFVKEISLLRTKITNIDNEMISIANSDLLSSSFKRIEYDEFVYLKFNFGIPYKSNYINIKKTINNILIDFKNKGLIIRDNREEMLNIENFNKSTYEIHYDDDKDKYILKLANSGKFNLNDVNSIFKMYDANLPYNDFLDNFIQLKLIYFKDDILEFEIESFLNNELNVLKQFDLLNNKKITIEKYNKNWIYNILQNDRPNISINSFDNSAVSVNVICKCKIQNKF